MQANTAQRIDLVVNGLITFSGDKSSRSNNLCDEATSPIESTTFLYQLDENEVRQCCALLAYQLRLKHNVVYQFDINALNPTQLRQFELFNHIACFNQYIDLCKNFIIRFRRCNDNVTARFSRESMRRDNANQNRKRNADGTPAAQLNQQNGENNDQDDEEFYELRSVYEQIQNMRKIFDFYFQMFIGDHFDRYLIYEKIYLDTCLSADVPLTMQLTDFNDTATLFASLLRLTLISTDFCNSQFAAFFGNGMMLNMLLYLTIDEILRDSTDSLPTSSAKSRHHWTRLTLLNKEDREAACLLRDINSDTYRHIIATLPAEQFDPLLGHVYMSKGDTLSTLFVQFNSRLFMRLYEWPERHDVKSHLLDKYVCDNIASYFLKAGRNQQNSWIKFFKRKRQHHATGSLSNNGSQTALPQIFINLPALHSLYDMLSRGIAKNSNKRSRMDDSQGDNRDLFTQSAVIAADSVQVKQSWEALNSFKDSYVTFFINGVALGEKFRQWYQQMCVTFILRSGGYRGFCQNKHPIVFNFEENLSGVYSPACQICTESLYSYFNPDRSNTMFSLEKWAKEVHTMIFPYNFLLISADFIKNNGVLSDDTLRNAWALKAQESLVSRRFTSDKCLRCHAYLCQLEKRSRLIIEEGQLKNLFISAMEHLPFIRDLMDFDEQSTSETDESETVVPSFTNASQGLDG